MMAVSVTLGTELSLGRTSQLFELPPEYRLATGSSFFDVDSSGRYLFYRTASETQLVLVENWFEELKRLVPN